MVVGKALYNDIYSAQIKTSDISILSDEFLLEVQNMEQKNVAYELLKKLDLSLIDINN